MIKRKTLGLFLFASGLLLFFMISFFSKDLIRIEKEKNVYVQQKKDYQKELVIEFKEKVEELTRHQIRLNLNSLRYSVEEITKIFNLDMTDYQTRLKIVNALTSQMRYYDSEGDPFVINSRNQFEIDDSSDCGQPLSLLNPNLPLINLPNRVRTFYDEIAWQYELKYILYSQGIIANIEGFILSTATETFDKIEDYNIDLFLSSKRVFGATEIAYIEEKYPKVFELLKKYKIVMHANYKEVEPVKIFFEKQLDSEESTKLFWHFNPEPHKEILEIVWIPGGSLGFNQEPKNFAGGSLNENFLKIGVVQGAQINKIFNEYLPILEKVNRETQKDILTIERAFNTEKRNIEIMAGLIVFLYIGLCFAMIQIILNKNER